MIKKTGEHKIDTIFVLIIFCVFALSVLMVLMLGASVYKKMNEITRDGQDERMLLSYIWTKVKNVDEAGSIYIGDFHGLNALYLDEEYNSTQYRTVIYHYDGWIYELFSEASLELFPEDGIRVTSIGELKLEESGYGLIKISTESGCLYLSPRSGYANAVANLEFAEGVGKAA